MKFLMSLLVAAVASLNVACASTAYGTGGYERYEDRYRYDDRYRYGNQYRDESIARAAHDLELAADQFYAEVRHAMGNRHTAKDARHFAREARQFHRSVEGDRRGHRIFRDFRELEREYRQVHYLFGGYDRRGWARNRGPRGHGGFHQVERAFTRLQRAMDRAGHGYGDDRHHDRYGPYDRYDNRYGRGQDRQGASMTLRGQSD